MTLEVLEKEYQKLKQKGYNQTEALKLLEIYYSNENITGHLRSISNTLNNFWEYGIRVSELPNENNY